MKALAVIPARGGSKGIPNKNLRCIGGVPLVARTVVAAKAAKSIDRVVVSTDSKAIADTARHFGAEIVDRPAELATDTASSESAVLHALDTLRMADGYDPGIVVLLQCTAPFMTAEDIDGTVRELIDSGIDSAFVAAPFDYFLWSQRHEARGVNHDKRYRPRRQDLSDDSRSYLEAGSVYAVRTDALRREGTRFAGITVIHPVNPARVWEIDESRDLVIAEAIEKYVETNK